MATWTEVEAAVPELAAAVRAAFDAHTNKVLATLRSDGSPRLSGNEAIFGDFRRHCRGDTPRPPGFRGGELWLGMMHRSVKALDLLADPRLALHSAPLDAELKLGDAKLAGRAVEETDPEVIRRFAVASAEEHGGVEPPSPFHLFRVDVGEVAFVRIGDPPDHLVIESWSAPAGYRRTERR